MAGQVRQKRSDAEKPANERPPRDLERFYAKTKEAVGHVLAEARRIAAEQHPDERASRHCSVLVDARGFGCYRELKPLSEAAETLRDVEATPENRYTAALRHPPSDFRPNAIAPLATARYKRRSHASCSKRSSDRVVLVDEAHHLRNDALEDLQLLTNFEMDSQNRLCLLLVGWSA